MTVRLASTVLVALLLLGSAFRAAPARAQQVEVDDGLLNRYAYRKVDRLEYFITTTTQKLVKFQQATDRLDAFISDLSRVSSLADAVRLLSAGGFGYANPNAGAVLEAHFPPLDSALTRAGLLYEQTRALRGAYKQMLAAVRRQMGSFAAAQAHLDQLAAQAQDIESQQAAFELTNVVRQVRNEQLWLWRQLVHLRINARAVQASYRTYRRALDRHALRCALEGCQGGSDASLY